MEAASLQLAAPPASRPAGPRALSDRVILRDQAYNAFSPLAARGSDPRHRIAGRPLPLHYDVYFGIYQSLWSEDEDGRRLYEEFPPDFFDLIIIDECHRSGWGTWKEILDHFDAAIHLGMTATPKRTDNVDTYAYFCTDEPEVLIDPDDPAKGKQQPPAYEYSLGQGIEDGFLATYKVHRVRTTVDKEGLHVREVLEAGAEIFVPEDVEAREFYTTPQFEREITLPDRTQTMVNHLAQLLRRFGPMEKAMVFCVDTAHAQLVSRLLNDHFGYLGYDDYAVPIVAEEGEDARRWLRRFQDSDQRTPVVATTAELLSTGVDVPACRTIVFMKTVASPVLFKQIVGRGSRLDPATDKYWFRVVDYTGATRLFDEWDRPPLPPEDTPPGPETGVLEGIVIHAEQAIPIQGASVSVLLGPNDQRGPIYSDEEGTFRFERLPAGVVTLVISGPGFRRRQMKLEVLEDDVTFVEVALRETGEPPGKVKVTGLEVTIADEAIFLIEATGESLSLQEYVDYTRQAVSDLVGGEGVAGLQEAWVDPARRRRFLEALYRSSVHPEVLAEVLGRGDADLFDLLAHLAFGEPMHTRDERAQAFRNRHQRFLQRYSPEAREVILALLEKYRVGGVEEIANPQVFRLPPFDQMRQIVGVQQRFGGTDGLRQAVREVQRRLYAQNRNESLMSEEYRMIIYAGREDRSREYKQSFPWQRRGHGDTMAKIARTILAMSNLRDGGHIVVGVEDGTYLPKGMQAKHLSTFSYDKVADFVRNYADPYVSFSLDIVALDEMNFVVFAVSGFDEFPVICKSSYGNILAEGAVYIRPRNGRPRSARITSYAEMRELLDLATEKGVRRFLEMEARVGALGPTDTERFEQQLTDFS
jgi:type I restriction enzyme R subunit